MFKHLSKHKADFSNNFITQANDYEKDLGNKSSKKSLKFLDLGAKDWLSPSSGFERGLIFQKDLEASSLLQCLKRSHRHFWQRGHMEAKLVWKHAVSVHKVWLISLGNQIFFL